MSDHETKLAKLRKSFKQNEALKDEAKFIIAVHNANFYFKGERACQIKKH